MKNALLLVLAAIVGAESFILWINRDAGWLAHPLAQERALPGSGRADTLLPSESAALASQPTYQSFRDKALRAQLLGLASPFKMMVIEYQMMEGRFPERWSQLGVDASSLSSKDVAQVQLTAEEVVILPRRVHDGWISLTPTHAMGGMALEWRCRTNILAFADSLCQHDEREFPLIEASFDCATALDPVQRVICRDHALMAQDQELARELQGLAKMLEGEERQQLEAEQLGWAVERAAACSVRPRVEEGACIAAETEARIETLTARRAWHVRVTSG